MEYLEVKDKINISLLLAFLVFAIIFFDNLSDIYFAVERYLLGASLLTRAILFSLFMIISMLVTPIPYSPFAVIAGSVFHPFFGMLLTLIAGTIGALIAFFAGRYFLHDYFWRMFKKNKLYRKMLEDNNKHVIRHIFMWRVMPQVPFDVISYFAGITTLKVREFALATILGMLPVVFVFTYFSNHFEKSRIELMAILISLGVLYLIYKIIRNKRYYVKGY